MFGGRFSEPGDEPGEHLLLCPTCGLSGEGFLHQMTVTVYFRTEENGNHGLQVHVAEFARPQVQQKTDQDDNPSPYRDGLWIKFMCERCESYLRLGIWQHKGQTFMRWHPESVPVKYNKHGLAKGWKR